MGVDGAQDHRPAMIEDPVIGLASLAGGVGAWVHTRRSWVRALAPALAGRSEIRLVGTGPEHLCGEGGGGREAEQARNAGNRSHENLSLGRASRTNGLRDRPAAWPAAWLQAAGSRANLP